MTKTKIYLCLLLLALGGVSSVESGFLVGGLESTVTQLGGGINELKVDALGVLGAGSGVQALSEDDGSLLDSDTTALQHDEIFSDSAVVWEATQWGDVLLSQIGLGGGIVLSAGALSLTHVVDSLVALSSVVVT